MGIQYIQQIFFSIFVLSILIAFDILIKFKRPLILKLHFFLIVISVGMSSYLYSIDLFSNRYIFYIIIGKSIVAGSILNVFTILYFPKFKTWVNLICLLMIALPVYSLIYSTTHNPNYINTLRTQTLVVVRTEGLALPFFVSLFRYPIIACFYSTCLYFLYSIISKYNFNNVYFVKIKNWTIAILILVINMLILYIPFPFLRDKPIVGYYLTIYLYTYLLLIVLYRPLFLNKSSMKISMGTVFNKDYEFGIKDLQFINAFYTNHYYTDNTASLENFAKILNVGSNDLYKFVYYKYSMTFNDLVNKNRVEFFVEIIHDPKFLNLTIDALAKEAGFSSRQHLYKPFKKFHGGNPSDLIDAFVD